jgi:hypothetical protein
VDAGRRARAESSYAYTYTDAYAYTYTDAYTYTNTDTDTYTYSYIKTRHRWGRLLFHCGFPRQD